MTRKVSAHPANARGIESIGVLPLHGAGCELPSLQAIIASMEKCEESDREKSVVGYEVQIRYINGDRIEGRFGDKAAALTFLQRYMAL